MPYQPDPPKSPLDLMIRHGSGPEPKFDPVMRDFLQQGYEDITARVAGGGLLKCTSLGLRNPWLYRLEFATRGYARAGDGEIRLIDRHVIALRFLPGYLREADRFDMLRLMEPVNLAFHPNISPGGAICIEIYPGEPLLEICQSLHDLIRWRLRQYDEHDALNPIACAWGRDNVEKPLDERPLFGSSVSIQWEPASTSKGA